MEKLFKNKKLWIYGLISTFIGLSAIKLIASLIELGSNSAGVSYFIALLDFVLVTALAVMAILAVYKENKFWSKILFVIYFSYYLLSFLFGFSDYFMYLATGNSLIALWGLGAILDAFAVIAVGVLYLVRLSNSEMKKFEDILIYVRLAIIAFNFIMAIVLVAQNYVNWAIMIQSLVEIVNTFVFVVARDFKFEEKVQIETEIQSEEQKQIEE